MPGGGMPALAPMNEPGFVCQLPDSYAFAGENAKAATPAAAKRALKLNLMCPPIWCCETRILARPMDTLSFAREYPRHDKLNMPNS
jgi:hypothetical protein